MAPGPAGGFLALRDQAAATFNNPRIMRIGLVAAVARLAADRKIASRFRQADGRGPDKTGLPGAIVTFKRSLATPGSRFD